MDFYPPSPHNVPASLTRPTLRYRLQAFLVAFGVTLFVVLYFALIAFFGVICLAAILLLCDIKQFDAQGAGSGAVTIMIIAFIGISAGLVTLYFVKNLFKTPKFDDSVYVPITREEAPNLFAFIEQICRETGAPRPKKIVLSPEVNASVYYNCSFWSLFLPTRKNLHIGLGLVNCLNIVEFKAVMAHEFGHFSQRSMRLGAYVHTANRVISEIIYGRDWLDESLTLFKPLLTLIRWILGGLYKALNFAHAGLSRQMEFNADLVAVSITGSDAIVDGLSKTDFAQACYEQTMRDLIAAGDHNLFTDDLFLHQTKSADYLRAVKSDPTLGVPPAWPEDESTGSTVFPANDTVLPPMWSSHPQHYQRERNCKKTYLRSPRDERPAWTLFSDEAEIRFRVTARFYELSRPGMKMTLRPAESVQKFIDDDRAESIYTARYHGMYEDGLISPGAIDSLERKIPQRYEQPATLLAEHADIFRPELKEMLDKFREKREDRARFSRFANKIEHPRGGRFEFRGKTYKTGQAAKLVEQLNDEIKNDCNDLAELDRRIFLVYMGMARQLGLTPAQDLEQRYRFHLGVQTMIATLRHWDNEVQLAFQGLAGRRDPSPDAIRNVSMALDQCMNALDDQAAAASRLRMPAFRNMKAGQPLSFFLDPKPVIRGFIGTEQILDGSWIKQTLGRNAEMIDKLRRILFKSLGSLLAAQEKIGEAWKARYAAEASNPQPRDRFSVLNRLVAR